MRMPISVRRRLRHVRRWQCRFTQIPIDGISDQTDDFERWQFGFLDRVDRVADRVRAAEKLPGERLVDQRHSRRAVAVVVRNVATGQERCAERADPPGRDAVEHREPNRAARRSPRGIR